jgi:hypothetical protein
VALKCVVKEKTIEIEVDKEKKRVIVWGVA